MEQHVVTGASTQSAGRRVLARRFGWSGSDEISSITDLDPGTGALKTGSAYEYDPRGYLIRQLFSDGETLHRKADAAGNLFRSPDGSDRTYGKGGVLLRTGATTLEHDADGFLVKKTLADGAIWRYHWDAHGRLVEVERPDKKKVLFSYDAFGRRTTKTFDGKTTEYFWDGDDLIHERVRGDDGAYASPLTTWIFEPATFTPLAKLEGKKRYGIVSDHLGSPTILATEAGRIAWQAQLDIYGVPREQNGGIDDENATENPWRFPGQYEDKETGLYYNRFRYYDPETGRYLSEDPIGLEGGEALYGYVHEPLLWIDPLGLTGTYMFTDGTTSYIGKGDEDRMRTSMRKRIGGKENATQFAHMDFGDDKMGFMVEYRLMKKYKARQSPNFANSPRIDSPGRKLYNAANKQTRDKVNRNVRALEKKFSCAK